MSALPAPVPGELEVVRGFASAETMAEMDSVFGAGLDNFFPTLPASKEEVMASVVDPKTPSDSPWRTTLARQVVESVQFDWKELNLYVRHLGGIGSRSLGIHADNSRTMRVLLEGNKSRWIFDQPKQMAKFPEGLPLSLGDAVVLNNHCDYEDQLRHGVALDDGTRSRVSYLFNFYS